MMKKEEGTITINEALDEIMVHYAETHGGLEIAMPFIRSQLKKANVDFNKPKLQKLHNFVDNLSEIIEFQDGKEKANQVILHYKQILKNVELS